MSGSLPARLVEVAGKAVFDEVKKYPTPPPFSGAIPGFAGATESDVGRRAVAAVLGQVVAELRDGFIDTDASVYGKGWKDAYLQVCNDLEVWAGVVERGEQA